MLWPARPNKAVRARLFTALADEDPDFLVHRWGQYRHDLVSLRPEERDKIERGADTVAQSFATPFPVRAILVQGHADFDLLRSGRAREDFEMKISVERAQVVSENLRTAVEQRVSVLSPEAQMLFGLMFWKEEGFGSHRRVNTTPKSEFERSLNRRAEAFFARAPRPLRSPSVMVCPHFGQVTRGPFAQGLPSVRDNWMVENCPFMLSPDRPSPCITVQWVVTNGEFIDSDSVGICIGNGPQGPVQILA
jgi:hypothetical protein